MTNPLQNNNPSYISNYKIPLLVLLLTIIAAVPRLYGLGDLGFYMDEETTAFASRSMAETGSPQMPSGMPYYRSLPHTWLNSISAKTFGLKNEYSYRLPAALFGTLTIPLLFLLARPFTGTSIAFLAALLLSLSEWHIITSRQARMYAPFLFFYVAGSFSILHWAKKDSLKNLAAASLLFLAAASLHNIGVFLALVPLIALFIKDYSTTPQYKLILFSITTGVVTYLYGEVFVSAPYEQWKETFGVVAVTTEDSDQQSLLQRYPITLLQAAQVTVGSLLGIWLAIKSKFDDQSNGKAFRALARFVLAILLAAFAAAGQLHGAFLLLLMLLLMHPSSLLIFLQATWKPLLSITAISCVAIALAISSDGLTSGIKSSMMFPFPNWITLLSLSETMTLLIFPVMLFLAITNKSAANASTRILLILSLFPLILVGMFMQWAAARYLLQAYPFILIMTAYALYCPIKNLSNRFTRHESLIAFLISCAIILSGIISNHGLHAANKVATVDYGDRLNPDAMIFPFYPDHKTTGEFVASRRTEKDIVIAEDVLEQRWYTGKVDYWLRKYKNENGGRFMYRGEDNLLHDIYINSTIATSETLNDLSENTNTKIWLITSGETYENRDHYLLADQRLWLEDIETSNEPVYIGHDKVTKVYCLNCEEK